MRAWIAADGIPQALYTDWHGVYLRKPTDAEVAAATAPLTQFGRMCAALGIRIIGASSPQAKGRVERGNGTHQDRLVKKLRRRRVCDYDAANAFLAAEYIADHNARFAKAPAAPEDFHTPVPAALDLDQIFRLETRRTVGHDWVVRHENRLFQIERQGRQYPPARSTVLVCEYEDGHLELWYRDARMSWTEITGRRAPAVVPPASPPPTPWPTPRAAVRPRADHPWKRPYQQLRDRVSPGEAIPGHLSGPLAAAGL